MRVARPDRTKPPEVTTSLSRASPAEHPPPLRVPATHHDRRRASVWHVVEGSLYLDPFLGALVQGDILPVLLIAMLFGTALALMGAPAAPVTQLVETLSKAFFRIVRMVTGLAPIGGFGAMAFTIGRYGIVSLVPMLKLIGALYLTAFLFLAVGLGIVARLCGATGRCLCGNGAPIAQAIGGTGRYLIGHRRLRRKPASGLI